MSDDLFVCYKWQFYAILCSPSEFFSGIWTGECPNSDAGMFSIDYIHKN